MVPEENGGRSGQESNDPEESEDASDEVTDGAPEADATDKDEPPARSPEAAMEETSPTEPSGGPRSKKTADDLQKQKDLDARARAAEAANKVAEATNKDLYARLIAAEKIASEMTRTAEENQALRIAAENAALKSENELLRKSATVNAGTPSKKSGDETKEADLPEQLEMYRGGDAARL